MATVTLNQVWGVIPYTPGTAKSKGDVVVANDRTGVVIADIAANVQGYLAVNFLGTFPKASGGGTAIADGKKVYWDANGVVASEDKTLGLMLGVTVGASVDGDTTQKVLVCQTGNAKQAAVVAALTDNSGGATADGTIGAVTANDTLTDNSGGSATTTLASISDTATKNAVASLAAQNAKVRTAIIALTDAITELTTKQAAVLTSLKSAGLMASA